MDIRAKYENLWSQNGTTRYDALLYILEVTEDPVDWAYEVWDDLVRRLDDRDNHNRSIAAQVLSNLARSDPQNRMLEDFADLLEVTRDARFVTARHCLQAIWKVGAAGKAQRQLVLAGLADRFIECAAEKNTTLIRADIVQGLKNLYIEIGEMEIKETAQRLIASEQDDKYRKKYQKVWGKL